MNMEIKKIHVINIPFRPHFLMNMYIVNPKGKLDPLNINHK